MLDEPTTVQIEVPLRGTLVFLCGRCVELVIEVVVVSLLVRRIIQSFVVIGMVDLVVVPFEAAGTVGRLDILLVVRSKAWC